MSIPKYDEMYHAFLDCLADSQIHRSKEAKDAAASIFSVSEKEQAELVPSGRRFLSSMKISSARRPL